MGFSLGRERYTDVPGGAARRGRAAIEEAVRAGHGALEFEEFTINNEELEVFGGFGLARGNYSYVMTPKAGGQTVAFEGKYLTIFRRQPDGSWKVYRDCFNANAPPQSPFSANTTSMFI